MTTQEITHRKELNRKAETTPLISNCCGARLYENADVCTSCNEFAEPVKPDDKLTPREKRIALLIGLITMILTIASFMFSKPGY